MVLMKLVMVGSGDEMSELKEMDPLLEAMRISLMAEHEPKRT